MSELSNKIREAAAVPAAHGLSLPDSVNKQIADIANPQYRVAVIGDFQVGKSTLINRVFFGDKPLLAEGIGITKTAIATDVQYGPSPKMEVYKWQDNAHEAETLVQAKDCPTEDDILAATAPKDAALRKEIAKSVSRVCIETPNESLRGYTVIDTPGLDDPDQELLFNTTWRIIPNSDMAILVVAAKQLSDNLLNLLSKEIMGKNGLSRILVLVSYRPDQDMDEEQRNDILEAIKAQLSNIGRDDLQVEMYCFDSSVEDIISDVSELRLLIRSFLNDNALPGREEKVANLLRSELETLLVEVAAKLKTAGATEAERAALSQKIEAQVSRFKNAAEMAHEHFAADVKSLEQELQYDVKTSVEAVFDRFVSDLEEQKDISGMQRLMKHADIALKSSLQDKISVIGMKLKSELSAIVAQYGKNMEVSRREWNVFLSDEFHVEKPFVAKLPPLVLDVLNTIILNIMLPGGLFIAGLAHLVLGKSFLNPAEWVAKQWMISSVKKGLTETAPEICDQIMQQIFDAIDKSSAKIQSAMESENQAQVAAIRSSIADTSCACERTALENAKSALENAVKTLNS